VVEQTDKKLQIKYAEAGPARMRAGATRAHLANMVRGVTRGYEKKLELSGVGFRAQLQGKNLNLTLGFSHPVNVAIPEGITIETPSQTEIVVKGIDRQESRPGGRRDPRHSSARALQGQGRALRE